MLLQEVPVLEELVLQCLVQEPGASAKQIWELLRRQGRTYSLRGVYKELTKLAAQGVLFKRGESFNIRLAWIMRVQSLSELAYERYTGTKYLTKAFGGTAEKHRETFRDLRKLDRLWTQLILTFHRLYPKQMMYFWCPYQWFYLAHYYTCKQFYEAIDLAGHKRCHIIGIDSFLSRRALHDLPKNGRYSFAVSPFESERSTYYTVIGDHVITVRLDQQITDRIHDLFTSVRSASALNPELLEQVFGARVRATLTSEQNPDKAARLTRKFVEFFGVV